MTCTERRNAVAEGTARARQPLDTSSVDAAECGGVLTGRRVRPMRADRQVVGLRDSRACALLQANAVGHLAPPVSTGRNLQTSNSYVNRLSDTPNPRSFAPS